MAMIKCVECGHEVSEKALSCGGCGATLATGGAGITGMRGVPALIGSAASSLREKGSMLTDKAVELGWNALKSKRTQDEEALDELVENFDEILPGAVDDAEVRCEKFKAALEATIDVKFAEVLQNRADADRFLTYVDAQIILATVRNVFKTALGIVPPQIEAACCLSAAILAPSAADRENQLKAAIGIGGSATGIGVIIAGVGGVLGWGAGLIASVTAFFVGTSLAGPIGLIIAGLTLTGIAAYFATTSNNLRDTERFLNVLKASTARAVGAIWSAHDEALSQAIGKGKPQ